MGLLDNFDVSKIYGAGGPGDPLIALGMGLLSQRGVGRGLAAGFQNVSDAAEMARKRQDTELARQRQATLDQQNAAHQRAMEEISRRTLGLHEATANKPQWVVGTNAQGQQTIYNANSPQAPQPTVVPGQAAPPQYKTETDQQGNVWQIEPITNKRTLLQAGNAATGNVNRDVSEREKALSARGMDPKDPRNQQYILTGKFPREDVQPITPTDKKAILEADELVQSNQAAIDALNKAKTLSPQAYGGFGGSVRGALGANAPDWAVPDFIASPEAGQKTQDLENLVGQNALSQLKTIFGGNPTEGERAIMLELQGSAGKSDAVRQKIYDRAIEMANRRLEFNRQRAAELRGGTYFKPKEETAQPSAPVEQPNVGLAIPSWKRL